MKKVLALTLTLIAFALIGTEVMAQTRTIFLNTGYDQLSNKKINVGEQDNEWRVIFDSTNPPPSPPLANGRPADVVSDAGWVNHPSGSGPYLNSRWISINSSRKPPTSSPYQYAFYFTLPPGFSSAQLVMDLNADDVITKVTLNRCVPFDLEADENSGGDGAFNVAPLHIFSQGACFVPNVNVLTDRQTCILSCDSKHGLRRRLRGGAV